MPHVTALVKSPDHVCCRYRLTAFRPFLEQAGFQLEVRSWPHRWLSRFWLKREIGQSDFVVLQRKLLPAWQLPWLRRAAKVLIFDFDDAIYQHDSYSAKGPQSPGRARAFSAMMRAVDAVVAATPFLTEQAANWAGNKVHTIPTCIDPDQYSLASHGRQGPQVQLVWIGSSSTLRGLERIRPILEGLGQRFPGLTLKVVCNQFPDFHQLPVIRCPWAKETEAAELAAADIGISWLPDDQWSKGKGSLKVVQYMAAGLPVVANPVGIQAQLVRHGETGFLVQTSEQWTAAVSRLANDPDLRRRMGLEGRRFVEREFNVATGAASWIALLNCLQHEQKFNRALLKNRRA